MESSEEIFGEVFRTFSERLDVIEAQLRAIEKDFALMKWESAQDMDIERTSSIPNIETERMEDGGAG